MNLKEYFIKYKLSLIIIFSITFLIYGIKVLQYSISIDTEVIINNYQYQISAWNSIGRFSLGFIKSLLHLYPFNYYISNFIMLFTFPLSIFILSYFLVKCHEESKITNYKISLFCLLIITSPIWAEQLNFTLQCAEVSISLLIFDLGLYFFTKSINDNHPFLLLPAIVSFSLTLGCYQSFMILLISMLIACYILLNLNKSTINNKKFIIYSFVTIISSFILYLIISKVNNQLLNIKETSYLTNQIAWLSSPIIDCIKSIIVCIGKVVCGYGPFFNFSYLIAIIIIFKYIIIKKYHFIFKIISLLFLVSPFLLCICLGHSEPIRAFYHITIVISIALIFIPKPKSSNQIFYSFIIVLIIISQTITSIRLFTSDLNSYKEDVKFATNIANTLKDKLNPNTTIIFLGKRNIYSNNNNLIGEVMGHSFFEWDFESYYGVNVRAHDFMKTLGYNYKLPTIEKYQLALDEDNLENFSNNNFIQKDRTIIIKIQS